MPIPDEKLLEDLCIQTSEYLWNMKIVGKTNHGDQRLLYPTYSKAGNPRRVSEQEARFAFVEVLAQRNEDLFYTV
ncbi:MAG: hypothetical protein K8S24_01785, partial [Candidatus Aegiribacteria sp.]|nr:hypothetical protein [Candidatus Aegiribacteria sp.]